jgi:hypothetical protein
MTRRSGRRIWGSRDQAVQKLAAGRKPVSKVADWLFFVGTLTKVKEVTRGLGLLVNSAQSRLHSLILAVEYARLEATAFTAGTQICALLWA